ncbi:MAG: hypothetical protein JWR26_2536 [Pedosphaera sp.]|nr:hypothetical protein [Pedosphaera sp.]
MGGKFRQDGNRVKNLEEGAETTEWRGRESRGKTSQRPHRRRTLRDLWGIQPKSLAAPSAPIYEMA